MKNRILTGIIIGGTILTTSASAYAFGGQGSQGLRTGGGFGGENPNREALEQAFENNDYDAWYNLTLEAPRSEEILSVINKDNFDQLIAAHNLRHDGDIEGAKTIMQELGLDMPMGPKGNRGGLGGEMKDMMEQAASGTYDQFVELIKDRPMADKLLEEVNAENFDQFVAMHNLMKEGKFDEAKLIADELGFEGPQSGNHKSGKMGKRTGDRANRMSEDGSGVTPAVA